MRRGYLNLNVKLSIRESEILLRKYVINSTKKDQSKTQHLVFNKMVHDLFTRSIIAISGNLRIFAKVLDLEYHYSIICIL